jgi:hypothetical protein
LSPRHDKLKVCLALPLASNYLAEGNITHKKGKLKTLKSTTLSTLSTASLALLLSACGNSTNTTTNNSTTTTANKSNTAVVANSNPTAATNTNTASNISQAPIERVEAETVQGELQVGKTESVILYVGKESGDYAAYCFTNDSEAGRVIMAACKDRDQCEVKGAIDDFACKVPGLEADLSASGKISRVLSAKSLGRKK